MDEIWENGQEIHSNDGIVVRRCPAIHLPELDNNPGTLSLMQYVQNGKDVLCIEWRPHDFLLIADADSHDQDEWSLVDKIGRRQRTASESIVFNTNTDTVTMSSRQMTTASPSSQQSSGGASGGGGCGGGGTTGQIRTIRTRLRDIKCIEITKKNGLLRFYSKADLKIHSEYFFQIGSAESFIRSMQKMHCLLRSHKNHNTFDIVDIADHDTEKLHKAFSELSIDGIKATQSTGWMENFARIPFGIFSKISIPNMGMNNVFDTEENYRNASSSSMSRSTCSGGSATGGAIGSIGSDGSASLLADKNNLNNSQNYAEEYERLNANTSTTSTTTNQTLISMNLLNEEDNQIRELENQLPPRPHIIRQKCLSPDQWNEFRTVDGRILDVNHLKDIIFRGGVDNSIRCDVWKYLLGYFKWNHTNEQRIVYQQQKHTEYFKMKVQWLSMTQTQENNFAEYITRKCQIEKDVKRTDRTLDYFAGDDNSNLSRLQDILMTYIMYNFDMGYVQGMSDLLAPILYVEQNEADAFWCFVGFMELVYQNFDMDQAGMKRQLYDVNLLLNLTNPRLARYMKTHDSDNMYICFRWLLVWFKREFVYFDTMSIWEVLWTGLPCPNFHLLICCAILDDQMSIFIERGYEFNEILKHVNELSFKLDFEHILAKAESIYLQIKAATNLTDELRLIIGEEPLVGPGNTSSDDDDIDDRDDEDDDGFDKIMVHERSIQELEETQKKLEEACERSMMNIFM